MKRFLCLLPFFLSSAAPVYAAQEDEIVIEMHGEPSEAPAAPTLWDRNAVQLTRKLRGKTREQVLYAVPVVSDKDRIVRGTGGEYALVEYFNGVDFRKFLFKAESPQTFVAAAATAADVLAVNKKYGVNIGLKQADFERFYRGEAQKEQEGTLPAGSVLYRLAYTDVNTPQKTDRWFLFENQTLSKTFETSSSKNTHLEFLKRQKAAASTATATNNPPAKAAAPRTAPTSFYRWDGPEDKVIAPSARSSIRPKIRYLGPPPVKKQ